MNAILLAGGYGTRLYPLTKDTPKALLPLGQGVVLDAIFETLQSVHDHGDTVVVTNHKFAQQFRDWQAGRRLGVEVVDDGTTTNESRLGAIRDLLLGASKLKKPDDLLVLGTDNLFTWSLAHFVRQAQANAPAATIAVRDVETKAEAAKCGVAELDVRGRITRLVEKPNDPFALTVALCVYYFPRAMQYRIQEFINSGGNPDAPGFFVEWLVKAEPTFGYRTDGEWLDIGSQESYQQAVQRWAVRQ